MAYKSKYTGAEVDALLDKIAEDNVGDIDSALSTTSENPVMNKVITEELNKKATEESVSTLGERVTTDIEILQTQLDSNEVLIEDLQESKADKEGYFHSMRVGLSDNLPDRVDVTEGAITFRESAGEGNSIEDGTCEVKELCGNTLVWNQGFGRGSRYAGTWGNNNLTINSSFTQALQTYDTFSGGSEYVPIISTHKYLALVQMLSGTIISGGISYTFYGLIGTNKVNITSKDVYYLIGSPNSNSYWFVRDYQSGSEFENVVIRHCTYDLTQMFGAGNEPSTIEEFYKRIPVGVDLYAYNEGEIVNVNINGIKSVNDNAWDEEWEVGTFNTDGTPRESTNGKQIRSKNFSRCIPNADYYVTNLFPGTSSDVIFYFYDENQVFISSVQKTNAIFTTPSNACYFKIRKDGTSEYSNQICIRLAHSGYKTDYVPHEEDTMPLDLAKYFPNGMNGVNGVSDSLSMNEKVQRFGVIDMGTLTWIKYEALDGVITFHTSIPSNCKGVADSYQKANMICSKYSIEKWDDLYRGTVLNGIALSSSALRIVDRAYTDIAAIKSALQGVMLYYELAEPIVEEIYPPLNLSYKVWDFGTEEILTDGASAPLITKAIYGFNATDTIRGNKAKNEVQDERLRTLESEIASLKTTIAQLQAALASMVNTNTEEVE